jgi:4-hydroxy-3-methylbut-2-en-1-yl diphosphate synthase IspG/GcpE
MSTLTPTPRQHQQMSLVVKAFRFAAEILADVADRLSDDLPPDVAKTPAKPKMVSVPIPVSDSAVTTRTEKRERRREVLKQTARMQYTVLQALVNAGGSMSHADFNLWCDKAGYGKGRAQFYANRAKSESKDGSLCTITNGTVTITSKGTTRLSEHAQFLGI